MTADLALLGFAALNAVAWTVLGILDRAHEAPKHRRRDRKS